jgi:hypothetical protein
MSMEYVETDVGSNAAVRGLQRTFNGFLLSGAQLSIYTDRAVLHREWREISVPLRAPHRLNSIDLEQIDKRCRPYEIFEVTDSAFCFSAPCKALS